MAAKRSILMLLLAAIVMMVGTKIPLPGLDTAAAAARMSGGDGALSRLSIFALGLMPLYNALALVEIGRLFLARGAGRNRHSGPVETAIAGVLALGVTALQGYGIVQALAAMGMLNGTSPMVGIATYMGATAVTLFLCYHLRIAGFRNGFWALWSVPALIGLPGQVSDAAALMQTGAISALPLLIFAIQLALSVAAIVFMTRTWETVATHGSGEVGERRAAPREILIWPAVLASVVAGYLLTLLAVLAPAAVNGVDILILQAIVLAVTCALIPVFVAVYLRSIDLVSTPDRPFAPVVFVVVAVQVLLVVSGGVLSVWVGLPLGLGFSSLLAIGLTIEALLFAIPSARSATGRA
ncbi:preprotein translocase subunit SecY [Neorhizobium sp. NPDC001467]|uniref:preprotein translocase subunit SecY n=1 Tax=Neorhizobium sp. NPDC001467 TaxID=3390595 RepID=UPI003CFFEFDF